MDYRGLNIVTKKDRYPMPFIMEMMEAVSGFRWLTKLDVSSAFHRIRFAQGEKRKTAIQTRCGICESLVISFSFSGTENV